MACVVCNDDGSLDCESCGGLGRYEIAECPKRLIDNSTHSALVAAELADKGSWPVAGGWLDQTQHCVEAVRFVWAESASHKAALMRRSESW